MKFCVTDVDYEERDGKATVRIFGVDENGKYAMKEDDTFRPYFYILPSSKTEERLKKIKEVTEVKKVTKTVSGEKREVLQAFVDTPSNIAKVREEIKKYGDCFEHSINFYRRYMFDRGILPYSWIEFDDWKIKVLDDNSIPNLKILAFDIETAGDDIIMIGAFDGRHSTFTWKKAASAVVAKDEKEMIERFIDFINKADADIIVTYNGDLFDWEHIRRKCEKYRISLKINRDGSRTEFSRRMGVTSLKFTGRLNLDLFAYVQNALAPQLGSETYSLNEVSKELLGEQKDGLTYDEIAEFWKAGRTDPIVKYNKKDCELTYKLAKFLMPQIIELSRVSGQLAFDCTRSRFGPLAEWFLARRAVKNNVIVPNMPDFHERKRRLMEERFKGGYVKEPKPGLHDSIAVLDFRSLYPSIIVSYNISPETFNCKCCTGPKVPEFGYHFCNKKKGFVAESVKELIEKRVEIKKQMKAEKDAEKRKQMDEEQKAVKVLANATYGMFSYANARWYCHECAQSSAAFGRDLIKKVMAYAEKDGYEVIYGDTDSMFIKPAKNIEGFVDKVNKKLPGIVELDLQGIYKRGIFVSQKEGGGAKKRYAIIDKNGIVTVRGFETVRSDWCSLARRLQYDVIRLVLHGKEKEAAEEVHRAVEAVKQRKVKIEEISLRTQLGKSLDEYKVKGPHIAVARKLKEMGRNVQEGMILNYVILTGKGQISDRAEPAEKVSVKDYDIEYYVERQILPVALRVLSVLGYQEKDFYAKGLRRFVK